MYSINDIQRLQTDEEFFIAENERYCLISLENKILTYDDVQNQCNFCILRIVRDYKNGFLDRDSANDLINKIDAFEYSKDMLGPDKVISKLNREIVQESLRVPYFNQLCVVCDDLYDSD